MSFFLYNLQHILMFMRCIFKYNFMHGKEERGNRMKFNLLDHMAEHMQFIYISELKVKEAVRPYIDYIRSIDESAYALDDWEDACSYILDEAITLQSVKEAKEKIIEWLNSFEFPQ